MKLIRYYQVEYHHKKTKAWRRSSTHVMLCIYEVRPRRYDGVLIWHRVINTKLYRYEDIFSHRGDYARIILHKKLVDRFGMIPPQAFSLFPGRVYIPNDQLN